MRAYDLAIQNFSVAEHLLQLYRLFRDLHPYDPGKSFELAVCERLELASGSALHHTKNENLLCSAKATVPLPSCLTANEGLNFLLRQAVLVASAALESFFWDVLRENVLTIIRAKGRKADESLRNITLTLDDYLSIEGYGDPDVRLQQIILNRFERGSLYDISKIDEIAKIFVVRDFWGDISKLSGAQVPELRGKLNSLVLRRNLIVHRADRPDESTPPEDIDAHGLRTMSYAWANTHVTTAQSFVSASSDVFKKAIEQLELIISQREEQKLAQATLSSN